MSLARRATLLTALAVLLQTSAGSAQMHAKGFAQGERPSVGPQIGFGTNSTKFFIGGQFAYPVRDRWDLYPTFQYYFPGHSLHLWSLDGTVRYWPKLNVEDSGLYVGGGLNISHSSVKVNTGLGSVSGSSTDAGLSLLSGWQFKASTSFVPFAQIRVVLANGSRVDFGGGINFSL